MNLNELKRRVSERTEQDYEDVSRIISETLEVIGETLADGKTVQLLGFGTFSIGKRSAREGRNPQTGDRIRIDASQQVRFKAGQGLKLKVNPDRESE
ncbi:HU family DNA-binding protein [Magnetofaba australis]|uniref:Putative HU family DNA-binding protein n=1 Tax=Magnetofaba australis IT-1 TaxID=1434232 RepID=A0A1Y2K148_9PROT|nr:HU family DNA-binding protein [Magnetofaba australis]OSM01728.1 putative HU family DNA-binding protein [Magnetofaba australis IT-1]